MVDDSMVLREVAKQAHESIEQLDKSGRPYWTHPWRVAALVREFPGFDRLSDDQQAMTVSAAYLHDVLEDTPVSAWQLRDAGASDGCLEIVQLLTKPLDRNLENYYARIAAHPLARLVKCADIADNTNHSRVALLSADRRKSLGAKYAHAKVALGCTEEDLTWFDEVTARPLEL